MSFKHIDPGYGVKMASASNIRVHKSNVYNPRNGVAFYSGAAGTRIMLTDIVGYGRITELYMKFDVYLPDTASATTSILGLLAITQMGSDFTLTAFGDNNRGSISKSGDSTNLKAGKVNTIWLHAVSESSPLKMTAAVNGEYVFEEIASDYSSLGNLISFNVSADLPISNMIISDEEIDLKETVVEVGHSAVETTMVENDGAYSSAQAGDYVLQTLDTTALYGLFGSDSKVTGMVAIAAPAYTTGEDVTQIKCRKVDGETVTDYSVPDPDLPEEADAWLEEFDENAVDDVAAENYIPTMGRQLDVVSDTTFASLNGLKVGWVTV